MLSLPTRKFLSARMFAKCVRNMSDHHATVPERFRHLERLDMNHYPVPVHLYRDLYQKRQQKLNLILASSLIFLGCGIAYVSINGTFSYMAAPPKKVLKWE